MHLFVSHSEYNICFIKSWVLLISINDIQIVYQHKHHDHINFVCG